MFEGDGCAECVAFDRGLRRSAVDVRLLCAPDAGPLHHVRLGINIAERRFLESLGVDVSDWLHLGRVFLADGTERDDYTSFVADVPLAMRGGHHSSLTRCGMCGRPWYLPKRPYYVLAKDAGDKPVYEPWPYGGLIVTLDVRARIVPGVWKGLDVMRLPALDEPQDGVEFPEHFY